MTSNLLIYQTEDGRTKIDVRLQDETVWLTQKAMAELFQTSVPNNILHLKNIFEDGELLAESVIKDFLITASEGKNYKTKFYSPYTSIALGYWIKSCIKYAQFDTQ